MQGFTVEIFENLIEQYDKTSVEDERSPKLASETRSKSSRMKKSAARSLAAGDVNPP